MTFDMDQRLFSLAETARLSGFHEKSLRNGLMRGHYLDRSFGEKTPTGKWLFSGHEIFRAALIAVLQDAGYEPGISNCYAVEIIKLCSAGTPDPAATWHLHKSADHPVDLSVKYGLIYSELAKVLPKYLDAFRLGLDGLGLKDPAVRAEMRDHLAKQDQLVSVIDPVYYRSMLLEQNGFL